MRVLRTIGLAAALLALTACDGGDPGPDSATGLLHDADVASTIESTSDASGPPPLTPWCSLEFGGIFGPGFDVTGREIVTEDATVVATVSRLPGSNLTDDRLDDMRRQTRTCIEGDGDHPRITVLDLSDPDQFGYAVTDEDGNPTGSIGFALADQAYVTVAVLADRETSSQMEQLLDKAVERADAAG